MSVLNYLHLCSNTDKVGFVHAEEKYGVFGLISVLAIYK